MLQGLWSRLTNIRFTAVSVVHPPAWRSDFSAVASSSSNITPAPWPTPATEAEVAPEAPQDLDGAHEAGEEPPEAPAPPEATEPTASERDAPISDAVKDTLRKMLSGRNVTKAVLAEYLDTTFGVPNLSGLKARDVVTVTAWITKLPMKD